MGKPSINAFAFLLQRGDMQASNKPEERRGLYIDRYDNSRDWRYNGVGVLSWANPAAIKEITGLIIREPKLIKSGTKLFIPSLSGVVRIVLIGDGTRVLFSGNELEDRLEGMDCNLIKGQELIIGTSAEEAYGVRVRVYPL